MAEKVQDQEVWTLSKPVTFGEIEYKELTLKFDGLSGQDLISAESEAKALGANSNNIKEFDKRYLSAVVAKAAQVPVDLIFSLKAKDFTAVTLLAQSFLLNPD